MFIPLKDYNPTRRPAVLVIILILLNFSVFIYQSYLSREYLQNPLLASDMQSLAWPSSLEYFVLKDGLVPRELVRQRNLEIPVGSDRWGHEVLYRRRVSPPLTCCFRFSCTVPGCTCWATCFFCGYSATTSKTGWAG